MFFERVCIMSQVRNKSVSSVEFATVYGPMAKAGHSAKEIAAKLYGVDVKDVTKAQIANITQKSTAMRKRAKELGKEHLVPSLKRGRSEGSGNTNFLDILEALNQSETKTPPDGETETPPTGETETQVS